MSLTESAGPLSTEPSERVNYRIEGPEHRLLLEDFPRRVRAVFGGRTVLDTTRGKLLYESGALPELCVPAADVRFELLERSGEHSRDEFKGEAAHLNIRVDGRVAEDAARSFEAPPATARWLNGHVLVDWDAMDAWFDEAEQVEGHLRDPYHRVDVRHSDRHVRVLVDDQVIADTRRPKLLSETGLANRFYLPPDDVHEDVLEPSETRSICPYKGEASYWTLALGERRLRDAAWSYPEPLENASKVPDHLSFDHPELRVEVDDLA